MTKVCLHLSSYSSDSAWMGPQHDIVNEDQTSGTSLRTTP